MTPELRVMLEQWLVSGTDAEQRHARYRLSLPDAKLEHPSLLLTDPLPLAESLPLLRLVNLCYYRSRDAACGCSGHRCALRSDLVTHLDCLDCVRTYGQA
jgi:hypothetical protein